MSTYLILLMVTSRTQGHSHAAYWWALIPGLIEVIADWYCHLQVEKKCHAICLARCGWAVEAGPAPHMSARRREASKLPANQYCRPTTRLVRAALAGLPF